MIMIFSLLQVQNKIKSIMHFFYFLTSNRYLLISKITEAAYNTKQADIFNLYMICKNGKGKTCF